MKPIAAELEAVLDKYENEVRPTVARLVPDGYGLRMIVITVSDEFVAAREIKEEAEKFEDDDENDENDDDDDENDDDVTSFVTSLCVEVTIIIFTIHCLNAMIDKQLSSC
jgi:hypothetical protein